MPVSEIASWAEVISAAAIILSLLFVGYEVAQNNKLSKIRQHQTNLTQLNSFKTLLFEPQIASVVARGRESYQKLSDEEKLIFRSYMEIAIPGIIGIKVFASMSALGRENAIDYSNRELRNAIDYPGVREWWEECRELVALGPPGRKAIDDLIGPKGSRE